MATPDRPRSGVVLCPAGSTLGSFSGDPQSAFLPVVAIAWKLPARGLDLPGVAPALSIGEHHAIVGKTVPDGHATGLEDALGSRSMGHAPSLHRGSDGYAVAMSEKPVTPSEALRMLGDAIASGPSDQKTIERFWYRFTSETALPEGTEAVARLAFTAGYATAMQHVGTVLAGAEAALQ